MPAACRHPPPSEAPFAATRPVAERLPQNLKERPSVDMPIGVHTRELAPASANRHPATRTFRPRRSSRPRRFPPPMSPRACCIPQPTLGFTGLPHLATACPRSDRRFPSGACPSELFPPEKRGPRHRGPLPPCRWPETRPARLRGLPPLGNPWRRGPVAGSRRSMLSWASPPEASIDRAPRARPEGRRRWRASGPCETGRSMDVSASLVAAAPEGVVRACAGEVRSRRCHHAQARSRESGRPPRRRSDVQAVRWPLRPDRGSRSGVDRAAPRSIARHGSDPGPEGP
jgi:hypothetical protein